MRILFPFWERWKQNADVGNKTVKLAPITSP